VMDVVEALVDHSLLRRVEPHPGHVRYRMLESIREYAAEKLGEEMARTALRHVQHFASFGDEAYAYSLDTHGGVQRRRVLALELENLLAGVDAGLAAGKPEGAAGCALAGSEVFEMHGPFSEGIALLRRVSGQSVRPATQARVFLETGLLLNYAGHPTEALEHHSQALAIAREVGDRRNEGMALGNVAGLDRKRRRIPEALEHYNQSLAIARDLGDRRGEGHNLGSLAVFHRDQGRIPEALAHLQQALAIHREVGNRRSEGLNLGNLAILHHQQGRIPEALEHFHQALAITREVGNRQGEGSTLGNLALLHHEQGRIPDALEHYNQALAIAREVGNRANEGITLGNLGDVLFSQNNLTAAEAHLRAAIGICDEAWPLAAGAFRGSLALIRAQQGAFDEARALLDRGEPQVRGVYKLELGKLLCKKAWVEHLAGDPAAAAAALAEAEAIDIELGAGPTAELGQLLTQARAAISE